MSGFSFRRRGPTDEDNGAQPAQDAAPATAEDRGERGAARLDRIAEYSANSARPEDAGTPSPSPADGRLGQRIEAIVTAAEQEATQVVRDAEAEAAEVRERAAYERAAADERIAEAGQRARELTDAAGREATRTKAAAEDEARELLARAEERVRALDSEAAARRVTLAEHTELWEQRLLDFLEEWRGAVDDLGARLTKALAEVEPPARSAPEGSSPRESRNANTRAPRAEVAKQATVSGATSEATE